MERWTAEHRAFVVETFFRNNDSVILTQRSFRIRFNVPPRGAIPSRNTILLWVRNFQNTAFGTTRRRGGSLRTVRTPANIEAVRHAFERSPRRSAVLHAQALRISDRSIRRILHDDLSFHPYSLARTIQEGEATLKGFNKDENATEGRRTTRSSMRGSVPTPPPVKKEKKTPAKGRGRGRGKKEEDEETKDEDEEKSESTGANGEGEPAKEPEKSETTSKDEEAEENKDTNEEGGGETEPDAPTESATVNSESKPEENSTEGGEAAKSEDASPTPAQ